MAKNEEQGERNQPASALKLQEAARAGNVPRSADLTSAVLLLAALGAAAMLAGPLVSSMINMMRTLLDGAAEPMAPVESLLAAAGRSSLPAFGIVAAIAAISAGAIVLTGLAQGGLRLNWQKVSPDLSRVSPSLGRVFSRRAMVRLGMSLAKILAVGAVAFWAIRDALPAVVSLPSLGTAALPATLAGLVLAVGLKVAAALAALAAVDYVYQRWEHRQDLMMSRREVTEELRQTQGDGRMRNRRRQLAQTLSSLGAIVQVPRATVVIAGDGVAVAIKHRPAGRPRVIAEGEGALAQRMVQAAERAGVAVVTDETLANELFEAGSTIVPKTNERLMAVLAIHAESA